MFVFNFSLLHMINETILVVKIFLVCGCVHVLYNYMYM